MYDKIYVKLDFWLCIKTYPINILLTIYYETIESLSRPFETGQLLPERFTETCLQVGHTMRAVAGQSCTLSQFP